MSTDFSVSEPWWSLMKIGAKKIEGRLNRGKFAALKKGDVIRVRNDNQREFHAKVTRITAYPDFRSYLSANLKLALPGIDSIEDGLRIYYQYYTKADERKYGVLAIRLTIQRD